MNHTDLLHKIVENIERVILDKRQPVALAVLTLACQGHLLIEDVPGVGKTSLAAALAKSLRASFQRVQCTPDIMPSDIVGFSVFNPKTQDFAYRPGAVFSHILLADEINRTSPKTQASLLEAMEEKQVSVDGVTYPLPEPFMVIATQNPVDYIGTYPLPEAQMDRFFMRIALGYPEAAQEAAMLTRFRTENPLETLEPVAETAELISVQHAVRALYVDEKIQDYAVRLVTHTRENPAAALGASPRATLNLCRAAQAYALFCGRSFVIPDDVMAMARAVLPHRIILRQESKLQQVTQQLVVDAAIRETSVPKG